MGRAGHGPRQSLRSGVHVPTYVYRCDNGHQFEVFQSITAEPVSECEECGAPATRLLFAPAIHFKGKGFHNTDYGTKRRPVGGDGDGGGSSSGGDSGAGASGDLGGASSGGDAGGSSTSTSSSSSSSGSSGKTIGLDKA